MLSRPSSSRLWALRVLHSPWLSLPFSLHRIAPALSPLRLRLESVSTLEHLPRLPGRAFPWPRLEPSCAKSATTAVLLPSGSRTKAKSPSVRPEAVQWPANDDYAFQRRSISAISKNAQEEHRVFPDVAGRQTAMNASKGRRSHRKPLLSGLSASETAARGEQKRVCGGR